MQVRAALCDLCANWRASGLTRDLRKSAEQVLAEVLNNIVEHAHADRKGGRIKVRTRAVADSLSVQVRDDGQPMPGGAMPAGTLTYKPDVPKDLPEGGFGWFMIRSLTTGLTYRRDSGWNILSFRISAPADQSQV